MTEPSSSRPATGQSGEQDRSALERIHAGEHAALAELYDRHGALLYGLIVRIAGVPSAADLLQDVFVRVWTGADVYDSALGSPRAWLIGLARYRALDHVRSERGRDGGGARVRDLGAGHNLPQVLDDEGQGRVCALLESLPAPERDLIEYAFFRGFAVEDLATHFQLTVEEVRERLHRGMLLLKDRLSGFDQPRGGEA